MNKYTNNSSNACVLEVDLEYPKESLELRNDYPLAPDKIKIKRERESDMLPNHQIEIADFYNISIGNIKKLVPNIFHYEKYGLHNGNLRLYLRLGLKVNKMHRVLELNHNS